MAVKKNRREEYIAEENDTKKVFNFRDDVLKIDVLCRVVSKKKKEEIHYPFAKDGTPKFEHLREIVYRGLKKMRYIGNTLKGADLKNSATLQS